MDRSNKIAQAYGYAVCFIAVVTLLFSSKSIIDASFDLSAPLRAERYFSGMNLTSFEAYKRERGERGTRPTPVGTVTAVPEPTEAELKAMFEAERADRTDYVKFRAMRSLVSSLILVAIAFALFISHWRWLRRSSE